MVYGKQLSPARFCFNGAINIAVPPRKQVRPPHGLIIPDLLDSLNCPGPHRSADRMEACWKEP